MIAGHFGLAAGTKTGASQVPLWSLMLASVWLDIVFGLLATFGIEEIVAGDGYGEAIIHAEYTHSLVGAVVLSVLLGAVASRWWGQRTGLVLAAVAFSHWLLDLVVHRADMPILPGNAGDLPRLGLGLWEVPEAAVVLEALLVLIGTYLYYKAATSRARHASQGSENLARLVSALILLAGLLTLVVDVTVG